MNNLFLRLLHLITHCRRAVFTAPTTPSQSPSPACFFLHHDLATVRTSWSAKKRTRTPHIQTMVNDLLPVCAHLHVMHRHPTHECERKTL